MVRRRPRTLRWWLASLAIAVGLPLLALLAWIFLSEVRRERNDAQQSALLIARAAAEQIAGLHAESKRLLERMAARPSIRAPEASPCDPLFAIIEFFPQYADLFLMAEDGTLICTGEPEPGDRTLATAVRGWIAAEARAGGLATPAPRVRIIEDEWVSVLAVPVTREAGPPLLLVLVQLIGLGAEALPPGGVVTVVDEAGVVLARSSDHAVWAGKNIRGTGVTDIVLRQREGRAQATGVDGVSRQYGFAAIPGLSWYVYVGVPTTEVMQPVRALFIRGGMGGALIVLLVTIFALWLSRTIERPIETLANAANAVAREGFTTSVPVSGPREVAALGGAFNAMVENRARAEARIVESERNLKALSDRLLKVQEEERARIAREIHDELGQSLTALKMDVGGLLAAVPGDGTARLRERIATTLDETVSAVQRIAAELRPSVLDDLGLVAAIETEARLFEERTGIECDLSIPAPPEGIPKSIESAVYRIFQEALTNVARHSDASRAEIRLRTHGDDLLLEVRDDGRGITEAERSHPSALGVIGMRERATTIGGSVHIEGIEGRGTIVSVRVPIGTPARSGLR